MAKYRLSPAEQETIIRYDMETKVALIDTASPQTIKRLDKLVAQHPDVYKLVNSDPNYFAKKYSVPMEYIKFGKPISEERRAKLRQAAINNGFCNPSASAG